MSAIRKSSKSSKHLKKASWPIRAVTSIASFFLLSIIGGLIIFALVALAFIIVGEDWNGNANLLQGAQICTWFTIFGIIVYFLMLKFLRRLKSLSGIYFKNLFVFITPVILIGTAIAAINQYIRYNTGLTSAQACNLQTQLVNARRSVYSIAGNNGSGSAFAVNPNGQLVTAYHVIDGNTNLHTYLYDANGTLQTVPVSIIRTVPEYDLALLSVNRPTPSYLTWQNPDESLVGQNVYAVGFPGNAFDAGTASISKGVVSRIIPTNDIPRAPVNFSFVQTDAAINPGNSGGALIASCGVIGINDAISEAQQYEGLPREEGIAYAISSQTAKSVLGL